MVVRTFRCYHQGGPKRAVDLGLVRPITQESLIAVEARAELLLVLVGGQPPLK